MQNQAGDEESQSRDHEEWSSGDVRGVSSLPDPDVQNREVNDDSLQNHPYQEHQQLSGNQYRDPRGQGETHDLEKGRSASEIA